MTEGHDKIEPFAGFGVTLLTYEDGTPPPPMRPGFGTVRVTYRHFVAVDRDEMAQRAICGRTWVPTAGVPIDGDCPECQRHVAGRWRS